MHERTSTSAVITPQAGSRASRRTTWVEVRYPLTGEQEHGDRAAWPWLSGWVVSQCGPDEWEIWSRLPNWLWSTRARRCSRCASGIPPSCAPARNRRPGHERVAPRPGSDREPQEPSAVAVSPHLRDRDLRAELRGRRGAALHSPMKRPGPEPEADFSDAGIEAG